MCTLLKRGFLQQMTLFRFIRDMISYIELQLYRITIVQFYIGTWQMGGKRNFQNILCYVEVVVRGMVFLDRQISANDKL